MFAYSGPKKEIIGAIRLNMVLSQNQSEPIFSYIFVCLFHLVNGHDRNEGVNSPFTRKKSIVCESRAVDDCWSKFKS